MYTISAETEQFQKVFLSDKENVSVFDLSTTGAEQPNPVNYNDYSIAISGNAEVIIVAFNQPVDYKDGKTTTSLNIYSKVDGSWTLVQELCIVPRVLNQGDKVKVCISYDGNTIAVYIPRYAEFDLGSIVVYRRENTESDTLPKKWTFIKSLTPDYPTGFVFGQHLVISGDGKTIATSVTTNVAEQFVQCLKYSVFKEKQEDEVKYWVSSEFSVDSKFLVQPNAVTSLAIDHFGETIVIGDSLNRQKNYNRQGVIFVYVYKTHKPEANSKWIQTESIIPIDGDYIIGGSVAISGNGQIIASDYSARDNWAAKDDAEDSGLILYARHCGDKMCQTSVLLTGGKEIPFIDGRIALDHTGTNVAASFICVGKDPIKAEVFTFSLTEDRYENSVNFIANDEKTSAFQYPTFGISEDGTVLAMVVGEYRMNGSIINNLVIKEGKFYKEID